MVPEYPTYSTLVGHLATVVTLLCSLSFGALSYLPADHNKLRESVLAPLSVLLSVAFSLELTSLCILLTCVFVVAWVAMSKADTTSRWRRGWEGVLRFMLFVAFALAIAGLAVLLASFAELLLVDERSPFEERRGWLTAVLFLPAVGVLIFPVLVVALFVTLFFAHLTTTKAATTLAPASSTNSSAASTAESYELRFQCQHSG